MGTTLVLSRPPHYFHGILIGPNVFIHSCVHYFVEKISEYLCRNTVMCKKDVCFNESCSLVEGKAFTQIRQVKCGECCDIAPGPAFSSCDF